MQLFNGDKDKKIIEIIARILHFNASEISIESEISEITSWDSLKSLQVMTRIEKEFALKIPLYNFLKIKKVKDILELVSEEKQ